MTEALHSTTPLDGTPDRHDHAAELIKRAREADDGIRTTTVGPGSAVPRGERGDLDAADGLQHRGAGAAKS